MAAATRPRTMTPRPLRTRGHPSGSARLDTLAPVPGRLTVQRPVARNGGIPAERLARAPRGFPERAEQTGVALELLETLRNRVGVTTHEPAVAAVHEHVVHAVHASHEQRHPRRRRLEDDE